MAVHVDYAYYTDIYLGNAILEKAFPGMALRAAEVLRRYQRNYRIADTDEDSLKNAVCAIADTMDYFEKAQSGNAAVQSVSIGSVSTSYGNNTAGLDISPRAMEKEMYRRACDYLHIYRGVG